MLALFAAAGGATALAAAFAAWTTRFRRTNSVYRTRPATDPAALPIRQENLTMTAVFVSGAAAAAFAAVSWASARFWSGASAPASPSPAPAPWDLAGAGAPAASA